MALLLAGGGLSYAIFVDKSSKLTNDVVERQLEEVQDLTTMVERDYGFETYKDGSFLTAKQFTMFYVYEARAGFDLDKAKVDVSNDVIEVTLPAPTIQSISVDPDKLRFFDQESSLLNQIDAKDTAEALQNAKQDAQKKLNRSELLRTTNEHGKEVVENLFSAVAKSNGYTVKVTTTDPKA